MSEGHSRYDGFITSREKELAHSLLVTPVSEIFPGFQTLEAAKQVGDWGEKGRKTRATINLDLACILLFRTLSTDIVG